MLPPSFSMLPAVLSIAQWHRCPDDDDLRMARTFKNLKDDAF